MIYIKKDALKLGLVKYLEKDAQEMKVVDGFEDIEDKKTNILIDSHKDNFVHACPATTIYRCCNYHVVDIMQGCPFDCSYCILQAYLEHKFIKVSADTDSVLASLDEFSKTKRRIGSGELADSLALDNIIPLSKIIVPFVNQKDNIQFEFKTKSANVANLFSLNPKNILVSFSVNPDIIVKSEELLAAPIKKRLEAAKKLAEYGYKIGFHFDPLINIDNFERLYGELIKNIADLEIENKIEFISIGAFRAPTELVDKIRLRKQNSVLKLGDYVKCADGKLRYFKANRIKMINFVFSSLKKALPNVFIYFCMEHESVWEKFIGLDPTSRENLESMFPFYKS